MKMKEKAVVAISRISMVDSSKPVLMVEGLLLLNQLLPVLDLGSGFTKEQACVALQGLTFSQGRPNVFGGLKRNFGVEPYFFEYLNIN
jgi:hypothetical protein